MDVAVRNLCKRHSSSSSMSIDLFPHGSFGVYCTHCMVGTIKFPRGVAHIFSQCADRMLSVLNLHSNNGAYTCTVESNESIGLYINPNRIPNAVGAVLRCHMGANIHCRWKQE